LYRYNRFDGGLIEGAKQKIWSIANEMISAQPTPELKLGLIGYRDRGDEYVVKSFSLTDDIDASTDICEVPSRWRCDAPESVNEALAEAIHKMPWSSDSKVLKIIFLVGDAPPHMDYRTAQSIRISAVKRQKRTSSSIPFSVVRWLRPSRSGRRSQNYRKAVM